MADTDLHTDFHLMTYKFHFMSGRTLVVVVQEKLTSLFASCLNERSFSNMLALHNRARCQSGSTKIERISNAMRIEKAAVLGSGTMGAQIAAHLANAGVPTLLLDIPPREVTPEEAKKGLTLESKEVRNRIARAGLEAAKKAKPAAFFVPELASLVSVGNFDDDLAKSKIAILSSRQLLRT